MTSGGERASTLEPFVISNGRGHNEPLGARIHFQPAIMFLAISNKQDDSYDFFGLDFCPEERCEGTQEKGGG